MFHAAYARLLRFGFRLLYNELAFTYDSVSWLVSRGEWRAWQRSALKHLAAPAGSRLLEVAHGTANLQLDLRRAGYDAVGVDLSRAMGRLARRKLRRNRITPQLVRCDARQLPFAAAQFPAVVCTFPTAFIVDPVVIAEIHRVLTANGRLVFVPGAAFTDHSPARSILEAVYRITGQRQSVSVHEWPRELALYFTAAGFSLTSYAEPCTISVAQVIVAQKL